jgi:hypothetical protein
MTTSLATLVCLAALVLTLALLAPWTSVRAYAIPHRGYAHIEVWVVVR